MKIEIKNIQHYHGLSEDSNAFSAHLYVDNNLIATCTDNGRGGRILFTATQGNSSKLEEAEAYARQLPKEPQFGLEMNLHLLVAGLVRLAIEDLRDEEFRKTLKRNQKNNIVYGKTKSEIEFLFYTNSQKRKISINDLLTEPQNIKILTEDLDELTKEGFTIFNTNIPKELIDSISSTKKKSNN